MSHTIIFRGFIWSLFGVMFLYSLFIFPTRFLGIATLFWAMHLFITIKAHAFLLLLLFLILITIRLRFFRVLRLFSITLVPLRLFYYECSLINFFSRQVAYYFLVITRCLDLSLIILKNQLRGFDLIQTLEFSPGELLNLFEALSDRGNNYNFFVFVI